jgi:hypothetical protein
MKTVPDRFLVLFFENLQSFLSVEHSGVNSADGLICYLLQAAFGRNLLSLTSFFTYVGLGLGFLGSSLALPFGVFVLICQRSPEKNLQVSTFPPA